MFGFKWSIWSMDWWCWLFLQGWMAHAEGAFLGGELVNRASVNKGHFKGLFDDGLE